MGFKDLTGQRFGKLVVTKKTDIKRGKSRSIFWECKCDCGNTSIVSSNALRRGYSKSCGCLRQRKSKENIEKYKRETVKDGIYTALLKSKRKSNNTTGHKGVGRFREDRYRAYITIGGKTKHLGVFDNLEDAVKARKKAENKYHKPYLERTSEENEDD